MSGHTKGPWWVSHNTTGSPEVRTYRDHETADNHMRNSSTGAGIASCIGDHTEERTRENRLANAHLIAAAPDMLEALEAMVEEWRDYTRINDLGDANEKHNMKLAIAAITKAKGGEA